MDHATHNALVNFIWGIADDVLRDVYVRGKYRDVILPMTVIRRLDCLLEETKDDVLKQKARLDEAGLMNQDGPLRQAAKQPFFNTSKFTLRRLLDNPKQLRANFADYLDGFSANVQEIIEKFDFRNQLKKLDDVDALGQLIEKFLSPTINLSPRPVFDGQGNVKLPGLDNHSMGTVFEELVRRFNEENNEEAGEHWTPRDVVHLMANLIFLPIKDRIRSGTYLIYDDACGTGGMLTVGEEVLTRLASEHDKDVSIHLYGQEINAETYAICKADLMIKGEGQEADNIKFGSTLSADAYPSQRFDFMLSNPPYGKSWKTDQERMGGKNGLNDHRFVVEHGGDQEFSLTTRSSDGQLMFLVNMLSKMKHDTPLGSRIAEVHNGSSLFTGDAGQGESNIRRWIIENDWLEAIIALPLNMFYNTGIATYIWVLTNRKPEHRRGKVQLIDATEWFEPLRRNQGKKNCRFNDDHIAAICEGFLDLAESEQSKVFPNEAFGYWKIVVERPLRLSVDLSESHRSEFRKTCVEAGEGPVADLADRMAGKLGPGPHDDFNAFKEAVEDDARARGVKHTARRLKLIQNELATKDESAKPVIKKFLRASKAATDPLHGMFELELDGQARLVEYEPDSDLRDTEQVPFLEDGGIEAFFRREVLPHVPDAWIDPSATRIGYEISFTRHFYKPKPLRTLAEIRADIEALERQTEGLLEQILVDVEGAT
ncbi:class I SAM-dependent DNA methyltransferase [soil metagenome]